MKTISVIVITYNGERFILQQLESIRIQTLMPDRVLIFDDASTDNTAFVIEDYILKNNLKNWEFFQNAYNKGWRQNCINALFKCHTDYILWSDQDDIWENNKIETLINTIKAGDFAAVYSSWMYIDENGYEMNISKHKLKGTIQEAKRKSINDNLPPMLGCSACFQQYLIKHLEKIVPCEFDSPDWLLFYIGVTVGRIGFIDVPLFKRRLHSNNVTVSPKSINRSWKYSFEKHQKSLAIMILQKNTLDKLICILENDSLCYRVEYIKAERDYLKQRILFLTQSKDIIKYVALAIRQCNWFDFVNTIIKDFRYVYERNIRSL